MTSRRDDAIAAREPSARRRLFSRETLFGAERRVARRLYGRGGEGEQWLRLTQHEHLKDFFGELGPGDHDALEISGDFYRHYPWRSYETWRYPEFDVCAPGEITRRFGVVVCDQVIEHVVDPFAAVRTLADLCLPGGHVIVGVPFLVRVHPAPTDYWRFTADGLRIVLERVGLDVVETRSWGNRHCVNANFFVWAKRPRWAADVNEESFPVNVWAIARKPG